MNARVLAAALACVFSGFGHAHGAGADRLTGVWKLVSTGIELQATGERRVREVLRSGYLIFPAEGRMMVLMAANGAAPQTDIERASLYRHMRAYTGTYQADEEKWVADVDVAWNPGWKGEQVRFYKITGDRMDVTANWRPAPNLAGNPTVRDFLVWVRAPEKVPASAGVLPPSETAEDPASLRDGKLLATGAQPGFEMLLGEKNFEEEVVPLDAHTLFFANDPSRRLHFEGPDFERATVKSYSGAFTLQRTKGSGK
jgi:hypothetical protein